MSNENENQNKQTGLNQTKAFAEQTKRQPTEWEKILANDVTHKGLIFKIYRKLITRPHNVVVRFK